MALDVALGDVSGQEALTTPFEDWCQNTGTHPEAVGAWETFTQGERAT